MPAAPGSAVVSILSQSPPSPLPVLAQREMQDQDSYMSHTLHFLCNLFCSTSNTFCCSKLIYAYRFIFTAL